MYPLEINTGANTNIIIAIIAKIVFLGFFFNISINILLNLQLLYPRDLLDGTAK